MNTKTRKDDISPKEDCPCVILVCKNRSWKYLASCRLRRNESEVVSHANEGYGT